MAFHTVLESCAWHSVPHSREHVILYLTGEFRMVLMVFRTVLDSYASHSIPYWRVLHGIPYHTEGSNIVFSYRTVKLCIIFRSVLEICVWYSVPYWRWCMVFRTLFENVPDIPYLAQPNLYYLTFIKPVYYLHDLYWSHDRRSKIESGHGIFLFFFLIPANEEPLGFFLVKKKFLVVCHNM